LQNRQQQQQQRLAALALTGAAKPASPPVVPPPSAIVVKEQSYVPLAFAKRKIEAIELDMRAMRDKHSHVLEALSRHYEGVEEQSRQQFVAFVRRLRADARAEHRVTQAALSSTERQLVDLRASSAAQVQGLEARLVAVEQELAAALAAHAAELSKLGAEHGELLELAKKEHADEAADLAAKLAAAGAALSAAHAAASGEARGLREQLQGEQRRGERLLALIAARDGVITSLERDRRHLLTTASLLVAAKQELHAQADALRNEAEDASRRAETLQQHVDAQDGELQALQARQATADAAIAAAAVSSSARAGNGAAGGVPSAMQSAVMQAELDSARRTVAASDAARADLQAELRATQEALRAAQAALAASTAALNAGAASTGASAAAADGGASTALQAAQATAALATAQAEIAGLRSQLAAAKEGAAAGVLSRQAPEQPRQPGHAVTASGALVRSESGGGQEWTRIAAAAQAAEFASLQEQVTSLNASLAALRKENARLVGALSEAELSHRIALAELQADAALQLQQAAQAQAKQPAPLAEEGLPEGPPSAAAAAPVNAALLAAAAARTPAQRESRAGALRASLQAAEAAIVAGEALWVEKKKRQALKLYETEAGRIGQALLPEGHALAAGMRAAVAAAAAHMEENQPAKAALVLKQSIDGLIAALPEELEAEEAAISGVPSAAGAGAVPAAVATDAGASLGLLSPLAASPASDSRGAGAMPSRKPADSAAAAAASAELAAMRAELERLRTDNATKVAAAAAAAAPAAPTHVPVPPSSARPDGSSRPPLAARVALPGSRPASAERVAYDAAAAAAAAAGGGVGAGTSAEQQAMLAAAQAEIARLRSALDDSRAKEAATAAALSEAQSAAEATRASRGSIEEGKGGDEGDGGDADADDDAGDGDDDEKADGDDDTDGKSDDGESAAVGAGAGAATAAGAAGRRGSAAGASSTPAKPGAAAGRGAGAGAGGTPATAGKGAGASSSAGGAAAASPALGARDASKVKEQDKLIKDLRAKIRTLEAAAAKAGPGASSKAGAAGGALDPKALEEALAKRQAVLEKKWKKDKEEADKEHAKEVDLLTRRLTKATAELTEAQTALGAASSERDALKRRVGGMGELEKELEALRAVAEEVKGLKTALEAATARVAEVDKLYRDEMLLRKRYFNIIEDMKGKIRVYARARPISGSERERGNVCVVGFPDEVTVDLDTGRGRKQFIYDRCFGPASTQEEVFADTENLIQSAFDGYNVAIFACEWDGAGRAVGGGGSGTIVKGDLIAARSPRAGTTCPWVMGSGAAHSACLAASHQHTTVTRGRAWGPDCGVVAWLALALCVFMPISRCPALLLLYDLRPVVLSLVQTVKPAQARPSRWWCVARPSQPVPRASRPAISFYLNVCNHVPCATSWHGSPTLHTSVLSPLPLPPPPSSAGPAAGLARHARPDPARHPAPVRCHWGGQGRV
jgi:hypothetical protein